MSYPGGKAASGVYQRIINLMPPHRVYLEPFLGGAAVMRMKRPAELNWGIDLSEAAVHQARSTIGKTGGVGRVFRFEVNDGIAFLASYAFDGSEVVYCDPPYLMSTRGGRKLYEHEMTEEQHKRLLEVLRSLRSRTRIILSGYPSSLYRHALVGWHSQVFEAMTRGGRMATEYLWFNFEPPEELHDYRFLGANFREGEAIKRQKQRWIERLRVMPALKKQALLAAIAGIGVSGEATRSKTRV
jgi:hypothetical protein